MNIGEKEDKNSFLSFDLANPLHWMVFSVCSVLIFLFGMTSGEAQQHLDAERLRRIAVERQHQNQQLEKELQLIRQAIREFCKQ